MEKIIVNKIRCKHCGDIIESTHRHDFVVCSCGSCFVDGGHVYLRRGYKTTPEDDFEDLSEVIEEKEDKGENQK